jgi:hypothetical protein
VHAAGPALLWASQSKASDDGARAGATLRVRWNYSRSILGIQIDFFSTVKGGFFLRKKPLECVLSVYTNSENALVVRLAESEDLLQEIALVWRMVTGIGGRRAGKECCHVSFGACFIAQQVGDFVEFYHFNAVGRREFVSI